MATYSLKAHTAELDRWVSTLKSVAVSEDVTADDLATRSISELEKALEELRVADEELRQQNDELQTANAAMDAERRRYQDLFEFAPDAYLVTDLAGIVKEANRAATELLQIPHDHLIGKPLASFWPLANRYVLRQQVRRVAASGGPLAWDTLVQPRMGGAVHVNVIIGAEIDETGRTSSLRWLLHDASRRKAGEQVLEQQRQWLALLHEVDQAVLRAEPPVRVAELLAARLRNLVASDWSAVVSIDAKTGEAEILAVSAGQETTVTPGTCVPAAHVVASGQWQGEVLAIEGPQVAEAPTALADIVTAEKFTFLLSVPALNEGRLVGSLNLGYHERIRMPAEQIDMLRRAGAAMAVAFEHASLLAALQQRNAELAALSARLVQAQEQERRTIARELHDEAGQGLAAITLGLGQIRRASAGNSDVIGQVQQLEDIANKVMDGLHRLASNLRPVALDRLGLIPALRQLVAELSQQHGIEIGFVARGVDEQTRLAPEIETGAYRAVQESLTNVFRHARASEVAVVLICEAGRLVAVVEDNGIGFDPQQTLPSERLGLSGMQERVQLLGGRLTVESAPGRGTTIFAELPCTVTPGGPTPGKRDLS